MIGVLPRIDNNISKFLKCFGPKNPYSKPEDTVMLL